MYRNYHVGRCYLPQVIYDADPVRLQQQSCTPVAVDIPTEPPPPSFPPGIQGPPGPRVSCKHMIYALTTYTRVVLAHLAQPVVPVLTERREAKVSMVRGDHKDPRVPLETPVLKDHRDRLTGCQVK